MEVGDGKWQMADRLEPAASNRQRQERDWRKKQQVKAKTREDEHLQVPRTCNVPGKGHRIVTLFLLSRQGVSSSRRVPLIAVRDLLRALLAVAPPLERSSHSHQSELHFIHPSTHPPIKEGRLQGRCCNCATTCSQVPIYDHQLAQRKKNVVLSWPTSAANDHVLQNVAWVKVNVGR